MCIKNDDYGGHHQPVHITGLHFTDQNKRYYHTSFFSNMKELSTLSESTHLAR